MTAGERTFSQLLLECSGSLLELIVGNWEAGAKHENIIANLGSLFFFSCDTFRHGERFVEAIFSTTFSKAQTF